MLYLQLKSLSALGTVKSVWGLLKHCWRIKSVTISSEDSPNLGLVEHTVRSVRQSHRQRHETAALLSPMEQRQQFEWSKALQVKDKRSIRKEHQEALLRSYYSSGWKVLERL